MRRSHVSPRRLAGVAAGLAALAATAALAFGTGSRSSAAPTRLGPEGVPVPRGRVLAGPGSIAPRTTVDGVACQRGEKIAWHTHAHLAIFVDGRPRQVPAGIGIGPPRRTEKTARGPFVDAGSCFAWLHTHAADGIVHTESPGARTYTLGQFFRVWGQPLSGRRVGPARGRMTAFVDGRRYTGNPRRVRLSPHTEIQLDVGRPVVPPAPITFPPGL